MHAFFILLRCQLQAFIAVIVALNRDRLSRFRFDLLWVLLCVNVLGYVVGYASSWVLRLPESMKRALTLEIGMQNAGLGATLAATLFVDRPEIAIAPAMYTFGCMLTGTLLARGWCCWDSRLGTIPAGQTGSPSARLTRESSE